MQETGHISILVTGLHGLAEGLGGPNSTSLDTNPTAVVRQSHLRLRHKAVDMFVSCAVTKRFYGRLCMRGPAYLELHQLLCAPG